MTEQRKMEKVIVIGCSGSGKTTFAKSLSRQTDLPLFHLDAIWHKSDRTHISREDFDERLAHILAQERFLIDGHYSRTLERRLACADTVFLFDLDTEICLAGANARLGKKREDMPWIDETLDECLRQEIERFRTEQLPTVYALLARYREGKRIFIFKSRAEADDFLLSLEK